MCYRETFQGASEQNPILIYIPKLTLITGDASYPIVAAMASCLLPKNIRPVRNECAGPHRVNYMIRQRLNVHCVLSESIHNYADARLDYLLL